jgi:DNA-binding NarL/FixJ family response regulator
LIRVAIVAPALSVRAGLRAILSAVEDLSVAGDAPRWEDLPRRDVDPDLVVVQPGTGESLTLPEWLSDQDDPPAVLVLMDDLSAVQDLAAAGLPAWGLLPVNCSEEELVMAVFAIDLGLAVAPPEAFSGRFNGLRGAERNGLPPIALTERELDVLRLLADGLANKQISQELGISEHTVKFHVSSIYTKLDVSNRAEAVRLGIQLGMIVI